MDAREVAMLSLSLCQRQGGWSDGVLKKQLAIAKLDSRDAALATQLSFGVLQNQLLLDFYLSHFSNIALKRMEDKVVQALRIGAYQMIFLDKIPSSAAVNSAVSMAKAYCKNQRAAGMVNGILRSLSRSLDSLPSIPEGDRILYLSLKYSHPEWLVKEYCSTLGTVEAELLLAENNSQPATMVMTNTTRTTTEALLESLLSQQVEPQLHPWLSDCVQLAKTGDLETLSAFQNGLFYVQDPASRLAIEAAAPEAGMRVLDCCAAPGGKSFAAAIRMRDRGTILSCDLHAHKEKLIEGGAERLGLNCVIPMTADARVFVPAWADGFDMVLVDAPCSGLGVIRKKPDIRYKDPVPLAGLPQVQIEILTNASRYVRSGGVLLYSTCTLLPRENEEVVQAFLNTNKTYKPEAFTLPDPIGIIDSGMVTLWPHRHRTDGFFLCKLRKEG